MNFEYAYFYPSFVVFILTISILEMPTVDALRLVQLDNHIDKMNHEVTTREKVGGLDSTVN